MIDLFIKVIDDGVLGVGIEQNNAVQIFSFTMERMADRSSSLVEPVINVVKYCFRLQNRLMPHMVSRKNAFS